MHAYDSDSYDDRQHRHSSTIFAGFWKVLILLLFMMVVFLAGLIYFHWQSIAALERKLNTNSQLLSESRNEQGYDIDAKLRQHFEAYTRQLKLAEMQLLEYQKQYNEQQEKLRLDIEDNMKQGLASIRAESYQGAELSKQVRQMSQSLANLKEQLLQLKLHAGEPALSPAVQDERMDSLSSKLDQLLSDVSDQRSKLHTLERQVRDLRLHMRNAINVN